MSTIARERMTVAAAAEIMRQTAAREAWHLDHQHWTEWLAMLAEDIEYWMPAWKGEHQPTACPDSELSLIYYSERAGLEDRVWRVTSGLSVASIPLSRTAHSLSSIHILDATDDAIEADCAWTCHAFNPKTQKQHVLFGRCTYGLRRADGDWLIARKKVLIMNDRIPSIVDFYHI